MGLWQTEVNTQRNDYNFKLLFFSYLQNYKQMKVGFDAKRIFHNSTGLGNYGRDIVRILHLYTAIDKYILYNPKHTKVNRINLLHNIFVKYPNNRFWKIFSSLWRLGGMTKQIIKDKVDIYHGLTGEIPIGLQKSNIYTVVTIHDLIFYSHPHYYSFFDNIIYRKKIEYAVKNSNRIIAISKQTKRDIIKYLGVDEKKINVVYQGCNDAFKVEYDKGIKNKIRKKYNLPNEFILNVGTLQERKNALTIVKAIHNTKYHLVLIGDEKKYTKKIYAYIKEHSLEPQITLLKNVNITDLSIIYQSSTVFCYPSICEGFGIPIIEALFSKTPVITSKVGCFPEAAGPNSIFIDPMDISSLKKELHRLFNNKKLRKQIADDGYTYVQKFTDKRVAKNIFKLYKTVLQSRKKEYSSQKSSVKKKISALVITYNEIVNIDKVLDNIKFADEIIVVDSFSTDGTVERIKKHPKVKLIQRAFKNFTDQKSFALKQASCDWVLFLDADERITDELKNEIHKTINSENTVSAYYFYRIFFFKDKKIKYSGSQKDKNYRLFKKSKVRFKQNKIVHETLIVNGESRTLKHKLMHYSYRDYESYKTKAVKYSQMKAKEELKKNYSPNIYHFVFLPFFKFFKHYILKLGVLDGKRGIILCYLSAFGVYARYKELKRLRKTNK